MAPLNFSPYYLANKPPNGQKTHSGSSQTYSDVKGKKFHRNRLKNENFTIFTNFGLKKVKISNFELQKCFVPQKKAENMHNTDLARKVPFFTKNRFFFHFLIFHLRLEDPPKFLTFNFPRFSKKNSKSDFSGTCQVWRGTKSRILVSLTLAPRNRQTDSQLGGP